MADEQDVEIKITVNDSSAAGLRSATKNVEEMGKTTGKATEAARLGYWTMGEAAQTAAERLGIPNQAARQMGNAVESLSSKMGKFAMGFGIAGLAVAGGVAVWQKYREEQEKANQEILKIGAASAAWVETALKETTQTTELIAAKKQLRELEYNINKEKLEDAIPLQKKVVEDLRKQHEEAWSLRDRLAGHSDSSQSFLSAMIHGRSGDRQKAVEDVRKKFDLASLELKKLEDAYKRLTGQGGKEFLAGPEGKPKDMSTLDDQVAEFKRKLALEQQYTADAAMLTQARIDDANREYQLKKEYLSGTVSFLASSFQAMYQAGGSHARKNLSLFKAAATMEAIINADVAAGGAYRALAWIPGVGPALGAAAAAVAYAAGIARVRSIRATTLEGGGGVGGSSPTYSVSPTTGAPTSSGGPSSIIINVNGQRAGEYELASGVLRTIYNNNGSVDGYALEVVRSA